MNIGFSDGNIEYRFTEIKYFKFFFHFCPICNIYSLDTSVFVCISEVSFSEIIVLQKLNVKARLSAFIHQNAREI